MGPIVTTPTPPHVRPDSGDSADNANAAPLPRWKKWLFTLVMLTIVVGGLQLAAYAYLRAFQGYDGKHLSQFEFDPYKNLLPTRNYVDTRGIRHNSAGFRRSTDVSPEKAPGTIRVFLMGASTGYGLGGLWPHVEPNYPVIANEHTIDAYLERQLATAFPGSKVEVINAAITSTWTHHNLIYLVQSVLRYDPDMVLFLDGFNDFYKTNPNHDQFASYSYNLTSRVIEGEPTLSSLVTMNGFWFFRKFALAHVAGRAAREAKLMLTRGGADRTPADPAQLMSHLQKNFPQNAGAMHEYIGAILRQRGIPAVFMLQPMLIMERDRATALPDTAMERRLFQFNVDSYLPNYEAFMKMANPWVVAYEQAMAQRVGATFLDLTWAFRGVPGQVYTDYCHLTPRGNEVVATVIGAHITPILRSRPGAASAASAASAAPGARAPTR